MQSIRALLLSWLALSIVFAIVLMTPRILLAALIPRVGIIGIPLAVGLSALAVALYPIKRVGHHIATALRAAVADGRIRNVADEVSVAIGQPSGYVLINRDPFPNVGAFPVPSGVVVMATTGAVEHLPRHELEALVAAQLAGIRDRWCLVATRAELVWTLAIAVGVCCAVATPVSLFASVLLFIAPRMVEATRDLCADVAAIDATRNPAALSSAMRRLAPAASSGRSQTRYGVSRLLPLSPFLALSLRGSNMRTSVEVNGKTRSWTEADEVVSEVLLRADRADALAAGADSREFTGREYWRRWSKLGAVPKKS
jgi:Zn-dependent protease with chaperone function